MKFTSYSPNNYIFLGHLLELWLSLWTVLVQEHNENSSIVSRVNIERIGTDTMKSFIPKKTSNFQETQNSV